MTMVDRIDRLAAENADLRADNQTLRGIIKGRVLQLDRLAAENAELRAEVAQLKESSAMACETPPDGCDCAGCSYAAEFYAAEEIGRALDNGGEGL